MTSQGLLAVDVITVEGDWARIDGAPTLIEEAVAVLVAMEPDLFSAPASVCFALSSDAEVRRLNKAYRGQDKPTNVLSFEAMDELSPVLEVGEPKPLGDVVLALETILAEAEGLAVPAAHHLQHLSVHGLLHLLGYDHETDSEAAVMEAKETAALKRLGIADPYRATEDDEQRR